MLWLCVRKLFGNSSNGPQTRACKLVTLCCTIHEVELSLLIHARPDTGEVWLYFIVLSCHFLFIPGEAYLTTFLRLVSETVFVGLRKGVTLKVASYIVIHSKIVCDRVRRHVVFMSMGFCLDEETLAKMRVLCPCFTLSHLRLR